MNEKLENNSFRFTEKLLYEYKHMKSHIEHLERLRKDIKSDDNVAVRAITYDGVKVSPTYKISNAVLDGVIDPVSVIQEIDINIYHEKSLIKKVDIAINNLDPIRKNIIKERYWNKMGWTTISQELHCDEKTLRKYKKQAIKSIAIELFGSNVFKEEEPNLFNMLNM